MSSSITLSAATRQNLLSLQDTASLLATTQTRLSTGKEVNSALDNPANFFTAQGLNQRSSTLNSLLDGISNGIQTIQAAATGLTNLSKLTDQLKSTAQQATQATSAVTAKATVTTKALNGAIDTNLISTGATTATAATALGGATAATASISTANTTFAFTKANTFTVDGINVNLENKTYTSADLVTAINNQLTAAGSSVVASGTTNISFTGTTDGANFSLGGPDVATVFGTQTATANTQAGFVPTGTSKITGLGLNVGDSLLVNGYSVSIASTDTMTTFAQKVSTATNGDVSATYDATNKKFVFTAKDAKTQVNLANGSSTSNLVSKLGFTSTTSFGAGLGTNGLGTGSDLGGKSLTVTTGSGANAKTASVTFGSGIGQVQTLDQLNNALGAANAQATMDATGRLSISTNNDAGSQNLVIGGTATTATAPATPAFTTTSAVATLGGDGLTARNKLVSDYNNLLSQIDQMANDASFNGINLLKGDQMKINFNEDSSSNITVRGTATNSASLKLNAVTSDDFKDNSSIGKVMDSIKSASTTLKSQSATYASNLSVVQNRQDFTKNLANVLDTGAANLTNADLNEEAANSQALSTRNSLAISALSLANQSQQGILQLLR